MNERLNSVGHLDPILVNENQFVDSANIDYVLMRLKILSTTQIQKINQHLRSDLKYSANMATNLSNVRKTPITIHMFNQTHQHNNVNDSDEVASSPIPGAPSSLHNITVPAVYFGPSNSSSSSSSSIPSAIPMVNFSLPTHKIHILYCLRLLRLRTLKEKVFSMCNYWRSVERRLTLGKKM